MPVHRSTLISQSELEEAGSLLTSTIEELRAEILEQDLEDALSRIEEVRERAADLEETLLGVRA